MLTRPDTPPPGDAAGAPIPKVLIVEDDARLAALLTEYLTPQGFSVAVENRGDRAVARIRAENPALVVLDLMLPGAGGLDVCRDARKHYSGGIVILTANKAEVDQAVGLELGADDYVIKPIEPRILLARMRGLLRRLDATPPSSPPTEEISIGTLTVNRGARLATVGAEPVDLTTIEFDLLWLLMRRAGEVVTRDELYAQLRGIPYDGVDRGMDVHVSRLRQKLEARGFETGCIKGVRGAGYLMVKR